MGPKQPPVTRSPAHPSSGSGAPPLTIGRPTWLGLAGILALAAALRFPGLSELPAGYLAWNEGFYIQTGLQQAALGPFSWFVHPTEYIKPPLYSGLVTLLYRLHAPLVAGPRTLSVTAGLMSVFFCFMLGRLLYDARTALAAAAFLAAMPGVVLVDHNIQVDPLFSALMMGSLFVYVLALRTSESWHALLGGVLLGLAVLTKQTAILALPVLAIWESWRTMGFTWLRSSRPWLFAGPVLAIGSSWYLLQLAIAPSRLAAEIAGGGVDRALMVSFPPTFWEFQVGSEFMWMVFPLAAIIAGAGFIFVLCEHKVGDRLLIGFLVVFFAYYLAFHLHSYYLLPLAPFVALVMGRACAGLLPDRIPSVARTVFVVVLVGVMSLGAVVTMSGQKWGRWSPMSLGAAAARSGVTRVVSDSKSFEFFGPVVTLAYPGKTSVGIDANTYVADPAYSRGRSIYLTLDRLEGSNRWDSGQTQSFTPRPKTILRDLWTRPVVFGFAIGQRPEYDVRTQRFTNDSWTIERVGPLWRFGTVAVDRPNGFFLYDRQTLPRGNR